MEDHSSPLSWSCYNQEEGIEEFKHSFLYTSWELETTILSAQDEIARKDDELIYLKCLLTKTIKERDEAQAQCQKLMLEKVILQQFQQQQQLGSGPLSETTSNEDEHRGGESNNGFSSSDSSENIPISQPPLPLPLAQMTEKLASKKPLPEKGKLLQAVMEAGPLLQTLLLAGPLPQWQHPPPALNPIEIPPVKILSTSSSFRKERGLVHREASDSSPNKYQKVAHQSPLTNA